MRVALMITCLADVLRPAVGQATVHLLRRLGHEVVFPAAQTCCGQPFYNSGYADLARAQARHTIEVFSGADAVVCPSGSCAAMLKLEYPHLFHDDATWLERATELAGRVYELADFLVNRTGTVDVGATFQGTVAYHYACHLRGLGQTDEAQRLIRGVRGARLLEIAHADQCCGFGGSFSIRYPEISTALVDDKARCVTATGADVLVSTDTGCLMNIGGRLRRLNHATQVWHLAELLVCNG